MSLPFGSAHGETLGVLLYLFPLSEMSTMSIFVAVVALSVAFALCAIALVVYSTYLHPAWRRQRRVRRACRQAFGDSDYTLVCVRLHPRGPSGLDLFEATGFGRPTPDRYFTYRIETKQTPALSKLSASDRRIVRRYLNRSHVPPHYGCTAYAA